MRKLYTIKKGDTIKCFNKTEGVVTGIDWSTYNLHIEYDDLKMDTHICNVCQINDDKVDPNIDKVVYEDYACSRQ